MPCGGILRGALRLHPRLRRYAFGLPSRLGRFGTPVAERTPFSSVPVRAGGISGASRSRPAIVSASPGGRAELARRQCAVHGASAGFPASAQDSRSMYRKAGLLLGAAALAFPAAALAQQAENRGFYVGGGAGDNYMGSAAIEGGGEIGRASCRERVCQYV